MLDAVAMAIERDRKRRESEKAVSDLRALFETLTSREREVMAYVTSGLMNKQVAAEMGVSEITVKIHRGHTMKKNGCEVAGRLGENGRGSRDSSSAIIAVQT
jgi:FixJ family two-component response regulator